MSNKIIGGSMNKKENKNNVPENKSKILPSNIAPTHLYMIIGQKEERILLLKSALESANQRIKGLETQLENLKKNKESK